MRRTAKRSTHVSCYRGAMGLGKNVARAILDLSETGVRLLVDHSLTAGEEVEVNLEGIAHRKPVRLRAEVIWCLPMQEEGIYCAGISFRRPLQFRAMQEM